MGGKRIFWTAIIALGVVAVVFNFPALANAITVRKSAPAA